MALALVKPVGIASSAAFSSRRPASHGTGKVHFFNRKSTIVCSSNVAPPSGVTVPKQEPQVPPPKFGFVDNAERLNSRAAMIGFFALLLLEAITHKGILELMGLRVGEGLPFEL